MSVWYNSEQPPQPRLGKVIKLVTFEQNLNTRGSHGVLEYMLNIGKKLLVQEH